VRFGSLCSGIEAASVAWNPLGWKAKFLAEIEPFPSAVLAHHYPSVPNLGDITKFKDWPDANIDVLCGGTPCQSFSNAGLRAGLDDPRGQLMLTFGAIAAKYRPRWLVWENVPGVLSSNGGRDFGAFLGLLGFLGYGFAYRVLDAQFVRVDSHARAVPQRRQRVFVVGCLGDWRSAAAVLLEREGLRGDSAPRREAGKGVAGALTAGAGMCGASDNGDVSKNGALVALCLNAHGGGRYDGESETLIPTTGAGFDVAHSLTGEGFDASEDGTGRGTPLVVANTLGSHHGNPQLDQTLIPFDTTQITSAGNYSNPQPGDPCHPLAATAHAPALAFGWQNAAVQGMPCDTISPTLDKSKHPATATATAVRRLMPVECLRLQGFPDDYLDITYRGKPASDGAKYKAIGNSWAVNVASWVGRRIAMVDTIKVAERAAA
jgi:DNA (cytosine-5)-methyltransferase 1